MSHYRVIFKDSSISHAESKSKYKGGFVFKNNRMNNSKAYNHDYYERNKNKWNKNKSAQNMGGFITSFLSLTLKALAVAAVTTAAAYVIDKYIKWKTNNIPKTDHDVTINPPSIPFETEEQRRKREAKERKEAALNSINKLFKYKYKVTDFFGKVRYFYTQAAYDKYCIGLKEKKEPCTIQEDIEAVNPGFKYDNANSDENCAYCTLAYDLRRRGYDVTALNENDPTFVSPTNPDIESWYENGKLTSHHISDDVRRSGRINTVEETHKVFDELASQGDGASGFVTAMFWDPYHINMAGHAMAYQVINGEAYIIDTQNGRTMNADEFATSSYGQRIVWGLQSRADEDTLFGRDYCFNYMRTDNLQPSAGTALRVKNADGSPTIARSDNEKKLQLGESEPVLVDKEEVERKSK